MGLPRLKAVVSPSCRKAQKRQRGEPQDPCHSGPDPERTQQLLNVLDQDIPLFPFSTHSSHLLSHLVQP